MTDGLGNAVENLTVVHLQRDADAQLSKYPCHDLHQLYLIEQRTRADDIDIALVELAIAPLLWTVGTPYGLYLIALKGQYNLALVLYYVASKGHGQVVA